MDLVQDEREGVAEQALEVAAPYDLVPYVEEDEFEPYRLATATVEEYRCGEFMPLVFLNRALIGVVEKAEAHPWKGCVERVWLRIDTGEVENDRWHGRVDIFRCAANGKDEVLIDGEGKPSAEAFQKLRAWAKAF